MYIQYIIEHVVFNASNLVHSRTVTSYCVQAGKNFILIDRLRIKMPTVR